MTQRAEVTTFSGTHHLPSFGWRHRLTWRQLSTLWGISVTHEVPDGLPTAAGTSAGCSFAIAYGERYEDVLRHLEDAKGPVVVFLERVRLRPDGNAGAFGIEVGGHYEARNRLRHTFRLERKHRLLEGLPERVTIYGDCPTVTPLRIQDRMEVLISLDGIP